MVNALETIAVILPRDEVASDPKPFTTDRKARDDAAE
jgi:hypothetical protein